MDNPAPLELHLAKSRTGARSLRFTRFLGRDWKIAIPFVLPMVVLMVGLIFWPFISAILMSTTAFNLQTGETMSVGLRNYQRLFTSSDYILSLRNTIVFTFWSLSIKFVTGMVIALILNSRVPFRGLLSAIMLLPWIVPEIVTALAWKSIYDPLFGGLNPILLGLGIIERPLGWLSDPQMAMGSVIAVNVWKGIPFFTLLLLAGLKAIDNEQYEAAEVDGANAVQQFRYVTLPGLRYVILVVLLLSFISTFNQFGLIFLMTGGGPGGATKLYSILAYEKAIGSLQYGPGSAIALSVAPLMALLIWLLAKFMRQRRPQRAQAPETVRVRRRRGVRRPEHRHPDQARHRPRVRLCARCHFPAVRSAVARHSSWLSRAVRQRVTGSATPPGLRAEEAREDRHRDAAAGAVPDHGLRAVPVLLGGRYLVQDHTADQPACVDLLAQPGDARAVSRTAERYAVPDVAAQLGAASRRSAQWCPSPSRRSPPMRCRG